MQKLLYEVPDLVEILSLCRATIFNLIAKGEIESVKVGSRRLVTEAQLSRFVAKLEENAR